ncbi:cytosine methyltransferase [Candidatus Saccharibacteria bacterium]|nr:cytosine methyltransferase [Candidatus Saccharibacteria bacterium]
MVNESYYYQDKPLWRRISDYPFKEGQVYQWRRQYIRVNKKGIFPTFTANMGMGGHNVPIVLDARGVRKLTPRECFRIQGFSETYKLPELADCHLYKQAGNSVSISVVKRIAKAMREAAEAR